MLVQYSTADLGYFRMLGYLAAKHDEPYEVLAHIEWKKGWLSYHMENIDDPNFYRLVEALRPSLGIP